MNRALLIAALVTASCAHEQLSAEEHRSAAAFHEQRAQHERQKYDPAATVQFPTQTPLASAPVNWTPTTYNPTAMHLAAADAELRAAAEHLAAAHTLEKFEDDACREIPAAERAACPLLASSVAQVRHTDKGLELELKATVDGADTARRLSCHLAYAIANGFSKPSCPLFVKGMAIRAMPHNRIAMTGETAAVAAELQAQARKIFVRVPATSTPSP